MRFFPVAIFFLGLLLFQCKSNQAQTRITYDSLVTAKVGSSAITKHNPAKTYALVQSTETTNGKDEFRYAVIKLKNNELMLEGKYNRGGYVRWINDVKIEVFSIPKHITTVPDSSIYIRQVFIEGVRDK
jgi:hypothetical protein